MPEGVKKNADVSGVKETQHNQHIQYHREIEELRESFKTAEKPNKLRSLEALNLQTQFEFVARNLKS